MSRLDAALVEHGLAETRSRAKTVILQGYVTINGKVCMKPAATVNPDDKLAVTQSLPYVGRGGEKLAFAIETFGISVQDANCLDIGASTGGFTDCLLQHGAKHVLAIDVGHDQLVPQLRNHPKVTAMDGMDIRQLSLDAKGLPADFICCDVSFISLRLIFPYLAPLLKPQGQAVVLVKPQFEAGRAALNKHGVVRNPNVHKQVLAEIRAAAQARGLNPVADCPSPILGGSGNTEFLLLLKPSQAERTDCL